MKQVRADADLREMLAECRDLLQWIAGANPEAAYLAEQIERRIADAMALIARMRRVALRIADQRDALIARVAELERALEAMEDRWLYPTEPNDDRYND